MQVPRCNCKQVDDQYKAASNGFSKAHHYMSTSSAGECFQGHLKKNNNMLSFWTLAHSLAQQPGSKLLVVQQLATSYQLLSYQQTGIKLLSLVVVACYWTTSNLLPVYLVDWQQTTRLLVIYYQATQQAGRKLLVVQQLATTTRLSSFILVYQQLSSQQPVASYYTTSSLLLGY